MAFTEAGARLTEAHRLRQLQLRALTGRDLARLWQVLDPEDISATWARAEPGFVSIVQARQPLSAGLSGRYFSEFHAAEAAQGTSGVRLAARVTADDIVPNLRLLGPAVVRNGGTMDVAFSNIEGEIARQVLNGGRSTLTASIESTRYCLGYVRVSDGSPCAFCAMLIGRGPVYGPSASHFDAHRKCGCTAEPVYRYDQPLPNRGQTDRYAELYDSLPAGLTSAEARAEFRRRYAAMNNT